MNKFHLLLLLALPLLAGCSASISVYDQYAYIQATSLKVDALALMEKAVNDADLYAAEIGQLQLNIEKAYQYEKGRPQNEISAAMWERLKDPESYLLGGFIKRWQEEKTLNPVFIEEAKKLTGKGFDLIAELESGKIKSGEAENIFNSVFN